MTLALASTVPKLELCRASGERLDVARIDLNALLNIAIAGPRRYQERPRRPPSVPTTLEHLPSPQGPFQRDLDRFASIPGLPWRYITLQCTMYSVGRRSGAISPPIFPGFPGAGALVALPGCGLSARELSRIRRFVAIGKLRAMPDKQFPFLPIFVT